MLLIVDTGQVVVEPLRVVDKMLEHLAHVVLNV